MKRRGKVPRDNGGLSRVVDRMPIDAGGKEVLYAVGFENGYIKFGKCQKPRARLRQLCVESGLLIAWAHIFGPIRRAKHQGYCAPAESIVLRLAHGAGMRVGRGHRSEYFTGLTKDQAITFGREARQWDAEQIATTAA